ncbi:MAG: murein biosynthesis integral membrane protein MurJ [Planctomycetota bacterium]
MEQSPDNSESQNDAGEQHGVAYRIIRGMFIVIFFWLFWKFGGVVLNAVIGRVYGAGVESDAYFFAVQSVVYLLLFSRMMNVLVPSFTPIFIDQKNEGGDDAAWDFASTVLNLLILGIAALMIIFYVYAEPITDTLVRGFGDEARAAGIRLLRWILPGAALMLLYLPLRALLNSYKVFSYPSAAEAAQKLVWAVGLYVTYRYLHLGVLAIAAGFVVGSIGMVGITAFGLRGKLRLYRPHLPAMRTRRLLKELVITAGFVVGTIITVRLVDGALAADMEYRDIIHLSTVLLAVVLYTGQLWWRARDRGGIMARFAVLAVPLIISTVFSAYRDVVTHYFQSFTARGVFSDIEFARRIAFIPSTLVAYALSVAMFPYLCELASREDHTVLGNIMSKAIRMLALGFIPLSVMTIILAGPVSRLVLDRGNWAQIHLYYTALALSLLAIGLVVYAWEYVIMQGYYSLQRMWAPAIMGIIASIFQFAFLAVPIYVLDLNYPVQIFFLAALAFPISRYFKNFFLLFWLRRDLPLLPARSTVIFFTKLTVVTALMGGATWAGHRWVQQKLPFQPYREHKVVVDNFETGPDTWFSLNASEIEITRAPDKAETLALGASYYRHDGSGPEIYRRLDGVEMDDSMRVECRVWSEKESGKLVVKAEKKDGDMMPVGEVELPAGRWTTLRSRDFDGEDIVALHWREEDSPDTSNVLYVDDFRLLDADTDEVALVENFENNGWAPQNAVRVTNTRPPDKSPDYALRVDGAETVEKGLDGYDMTETSLFRCRMYNPTEQEGTATVRLVGAEVQDEKQIDLRAGGWTRVEMPAGELEGKGQRNDFEGLRRMEVTTDLDEAYVDDATFRRPARRMYELVKLVHCVIPTLAGLIVGAILIPLLRFEELNDVIRWIKNKGWQRDEADAEDLEAFKE